MRFGYLPDPFDARDRLLRRDLLGVPAEMPPPEASLNSFLPPILDQQNEDCTAHATWYALHIAASKAGIELEQVSRLFLYWNARNYHNGTNFDGGTYIRAVFKALGKLGFCDEDWWPYGGEELVNERPEMVAYEMAIDQVIGLEYYRIDSTGAQRVLDVMNAIHHGHAVVFGILVDKGFVHAEHDLEEPVSEANATGGHALTITAYDENGFYGPNSWGPAWNGNGFYRMSKHFLASEAPTDLWVVVAAPQFSDDRQTTPRGDQ
jgi:hypothetical protein